MTKKSQLHTAYGYRDDGTIGSYPAHAPTDECRGANGGPCPEHKAGMCEHSHRSTDAAQACSRNRLGDVDYDDQMVIAYPPGYQYAIGPFEDEEAVREHFRKFPVTKQDAIVRKLVTP